MFGSSWVHAPLQGIHCPCYDVNMHEFCEVEVYNVTRKWHSILIHLPSCRTRQMNFCMVRFRASESSTCTAYTANNILVRLQTTFKSEGLKNHEYQAPCLALELQHIVHTIPLVVSSGGPSLYAWHDDTHNL